MATLETRSDQNVPAAHKTAPTNKKLHGRAFYESIGSPKYVVAPMVDQSEFAWRMLTRSFLTEEEKKKMLAYTPMFHARLFSQESKYRKAHFQALTLDSNEPWLDGNPAIDRPLFVQFCANDPEALLSAAQQVAPYCDAVDLNLGCPQGIARKGHYGAFLQEDQDLVFRLINTLHKELSIPVTAKIRILETREETLAYAQNVLRAGASILTIHGRRRDQKGHLTGMADWKMLRFLRDSLPPETVLFANGNILQGSNMDECLAATGADGIMSAEGNLSDPALFATPPPPGQEGREYWRGKDGKGGWRVDAITRRYLDILHKYALGNEPPKRPPLFISGDDTAWMEDTQQQTETESDGPAKKRRKKDSNNNCTSNQNAQGKRDEPSPNLVAMQPHLFHLLRHLVSKHTDVRDMLGRSRRDGIQGYERVLQAVERKVAQGLLEYEATGGRSFEEELEKLGDPKDEEGLEEGESSKGTVRKCKRPWWVAQPIIRPLPKEALAKGAIRLSKKELEAKAQAEVEAEAKNGEKSDGGKGEVDGKSSGGGEDDGIKKEITQRDALVSG
ncbi:tRNA dihydrouridine synthase [Conoideocrella luteorostrata]|uniref:tRNA-dihydrouridine(16/17) synthase [NAD(P)(+)] n=1 Tax=Conoideocrella luteorostrata TaxID=1105319 RepID=A0AAJ0CQ88_9HYPO|nr:tRNA dihydrouridine synthase [Conoideocrella luteorostrata]